MFYISRCWASPHTHTKSQDKDFCTVSLHPVSLLHSVIWFYICWLWENNLFGFNIHSIFQVYIRIVIEYLKSIVLQKTNTTCTYLYVDVKTLQGRWMLTCLLAKSAAVKLKKGNHACVFEQFVGRNHDWKYKKKEQKDSHLPPPNYCERLQMTNMMCFWLITPREFRSLYSMYL